MIGPLPAPVPQLDGSPQAKVNCGPASTASLLSFASRKLLVPTPSQVRAKGAMGIGPTSIANQKQAVANYSAEFAALSLAAPELLRLGYVTVDDFLTSLVSARRDHLVPIKYSVVNTQPAYSSDPGFDGYHFVTAMRIYRRRLDGLYHRVRPRELARVYAEVDRHFTLVYDPLADRRRPSVPQAPQLWPIRLLFQAGDAFNDASPWDGKMSVAYIERAAQIGDES